jgi:hypothetical protein
MTSLLAAALLVLANPGDAPQFGTLSMRCGDLVEETTVAEMHVVALAADDCEITLRSNSEVRLTRRRAVRSPGVEPVVPHTVTLTPSKDNTLYESGAGSISNGAGIHLFAGSTASRARRRALLAFDLSGIPPGSQITRVALTLRISQSISGPQTMRLHRVSTNWGEGTSNAGSSRDGDGAPSQSGDATWVHTFFPDVRWSSPGGDFETTADATAQTTGSISWESSAMIARVQQWLDQPSTNFGWIVIGNEGASTTAYRFDSREVVPETTRPALTIEFNSRP